MTEAAERWLPVVGWEGFYEVSDLGRVRSLPRGGFPGKLLSPHQNKKGYLEITPCKNGKPKTCQIQHLVAEAFIGPRPQGMYCCHSNGDPSDNRLPNLRWDTPSANQADKVRHGRLPLGERCGSAKLTKSQVLAIRADQRPSRLVAADFGISNTAVCLIKRRKTWSHIA